MADLDAFLHQEENFTKLYSISPMKIQYSTSLIEKLILLEEPLMLVMQKENALLTALRQ